MLLILLANAQHSFTLCSWNIANFGQSKTQETIDYIAKTVKKYDVVAIIEVVAGEGGPGAVERLKTTLNKNSDDWEYAVSAKTSSVINGTERYAVFWKKANLVRVSPAILENAYSDKIDREPFLVGFKVPDGQTFTVAPFHAVPTAKKPEKEVKWLQYIPAEYPQKNIIFCGDFNLSGAHPSFDPLKSKGYDAVFIDEKTSLKMNCEADDCLASIYDNVFFRTSKMQVTRSGTIKFYKDFTDFKKARKVSDHIPVFVEFSLN